MRKFELLRAFSEMFDFKTVTDENGNEYVIYANSVLNEIGSELKDKTQFEAVENHIHLIDNVKKYDFDELIEIGKVLGETQMSALKSKYPDKEFCVFVTVDIGESMIIRFHQVWENEPVYYNPDDFNSEKTRVLMFRK
ncbi:MAG: hypothetical protein E7516_00295 [Ruminococcaceae bacterium]|nr:hypothetical protein [Oscillospiraceae bacterium]